MNPSPLWRRAALLGSAWASVEIVVGSFLHNIRFPLAGTILAALGVLLLVAGRRIWNQPGLLWRAGVVCALMKSLSPSAIILGPMAGIVLESLLLEASMRVLGPGLAGALLGGALGTCLPILQKAAGLLITYGTDVARLYAAMVESAATALTLQLDPVELLLMLLAMSAMLGIVASLAGIRLARRSRDEFRHVETATDRSFDLEAVDSTQRFSTKLLALHLLLIPAGLIAIGTLPLPVALIFIALYLVGCLTRYRRLAGRLGRPRLWVEFALVTLLAGFFLGNLSRPEWTTAGLAAGAAMTLRAAFMIVAFSSISVELRNPAVVRWFIRRGFGEISSALGIAFQALPAVIVILDQDRAFLRHPWNSLGRVLGTVVAWVEQKEEGPAMVSFLLTGERGSGKTTTLLRLSEELRRSGIPVGGIAAPAVFTDGQCVGYDLMDLASGARRTLCRRAIPPTGITQGPFEFLPETFSWGTEILGNTHVGVLCIDELGPLELSGGGWSQALEQILRTAPPVLVVTARPTLTEAVLKRWQLRAPQRWHAGIDEFGELARSVARAAREASPGAKRS